MLFEGLHVSGFAGNNACLRSAQHLISAEAHEVSTIFYYLFWGGFMVAIGPAFGGKENPAAHVFHKRNPFFAG